MIDFRYHLVSLISVFLALAVGVVLGAGPLQNSLGSALNDQVSQLRADRNDTQSRLEETETAVNERDEYIAAAADAYLPGTLKGTAVAVVVLPQAEADDVAAVVDRLTQAGAGVEARVSLTSAWTDLSRETFRSTYAGRFTQYLSGAAGTEANAVLGEGLGTSLLGGANASTLTDLLTASDTPLVTVDDPAEGAVAGVVVVGPRSATGSAKATAKPTPTEDPTAWTAALRGLASVVPTVVVGAGADKEEVVTLLRADGSEKLSTVDSVGQASAAVSCVLALVAATGSTYGHWGFDAGAQAVMPPLPEAAATPAPQAGASGTQGEQPAEAAQGEQPAEAPASQG